MRSALVDYCALGALTGALAGASLLPSGGMEAVPVAAGLIVAGALVFAPVGAVLAATEARWGLRPLFGCAVVFGLLGAVYGGLVGGVLGFAAMLADDSDNLLKGLAPLLGAWVGGSTLCAQLAWFAPLHGRRGVLGRSRRWLLAVAVPVTPVAVAVVAGAVAVVVMAAAAG